MSRLTRCVLPTLALVLGLALPALGQTPITIIHVNDTHSHVDSFGPRDANLEGTIGGLERAAGLIGRMKATDPNPLFVHAGDAFHGSFFFNGLFDVPELLILKQLGIDAMAVGNHEFDLTPAALVGALSQVGAFPMTSANLDYGACTLPQPCALLPNWVQPGLIKDAGGVKVGFFGMTTPTDLTMQPSPVKVLPYVNETPPSQIPVKLAQIAQAEVDALRGQGAQVVIMLSHLGYLADAFVASRVEGLDVIVQGHDHDVYAAPVWLDAPGGRKVPAVSAGDNYLYVGRLRLTYTAGAGVSLDGWELLPVDESVPPVPQVAATVEYFKSLITQKCGDVFHTVVGYAPYEITRKYDPAKQRRDTAMGNLITDALRSRTGTDIALTVTGLISEGLSAGPLVGDDVFRPISYGYDAATCYGLKLATFEITGAELLKGMETTLQMSLQAQNDTTDLQFSGLRYKYDSSQSAGSRVILDSVHVNGEKLEPARTYTVTTNTAIPMVLPKLGVQITNVRLLPDFDYVVLRDYIQQLGVVDYSSESRIRDVAVLP